MKRSFLFYHWLALSGYTALTILITWPVTPRFFTHIPGTGDAPWFLWQLWWFKHALLELQQSPYLTDLIFYPLKDVPVMAQTPVNELFALPLQVAANIVVFYNVLFLLSYILSGYFTYLLGLAFVRRRALAFIGGLIFAFCAYRNIRGLGHLSLLTTQWMPLTLLLTYQWWRRPTWQRSIAAGVAASLVALSSPYYLGLFLFPVAAVAVGTVLFWQRAAMWQKVRWQSGGLGILIFLGLTIPPYLHYAQLKPELYVLIDALKNTATLNSADLLSWLLPSGLHPFWTPYTGRLYATFATPNQMETTVFVGYLPLLLLFLSFWYVRWQPELRFWQLLAGVTWLLSLGPVLYLQGQALFTWMPYRFLMVLPGFDSFRIPSRIGITAALALSVIAVLVLDQLITRYRWRGWPLALLGGTLLMLSNNLVSFPYPQTDVRLPTLYNRVAASPPEAIAELPAGEYFQAGYNFFNDVSLAMYYQTFHQQPMVSGYLGRRPSRLHEPEHTLPFVRHFFYDGRDQSPVHFPILARLPAAFRPGEMEFAPALLRQSGIGYVVLHASPSQPTFFPNAARLLNQALGLPIEDDGARRLYQVPQPAYQLVNVPLYPLTAATPLEAEQLAAQVTDQPNALRPVLAAGPLTFTIPYTGTWVLQGEWLGEATSTLALQLDAQPLEFQQDAYADATLAWRAAITLTPGRHQLSVSPALTQTGTFQAICTQLCLRDFTIRLAEPTVPAAQPPLATLVNEQGQSVSLLTTQWLTSADEPDPALRSDWLLTVWRLDETTFAQLQSAPETMPALYMHLTNPEGVTQFQVDHQLGERHLALTDAPIIFDLVPLPWPAEELAQTELRLGLWYPTQQTYFWATAPTQVDEANRLQLGSLDRWRQSIASPAIPFDSQQKSTFALASEKTPFLLLQGRIYRSAELEATPQLLTTWRVPANFRVQKELELVVQVTTATGESLHQSVQPLGDSNLLDVDSDYLFHNTPLPSFAAVAPENNVWIGLYDQRSNQWLTATSSASKAKEMIQLGSWKTLETSPLLP
ncbi:MAG: hypothetical protein KF832_03585 [Caldilineaceae bacterium]|nr:hypothetical protein [Caldilineaceae bacterium]